MDGHHVKSLDRLNRDLSKVIVIDWNPHSTKFHPENSFNLQRWDGDDSDTTLFDLTAFLKSELLNLGGFRTNSYYFSHFSRGHCRRWRCARSYDILQSELGYNTSFNISNYTKITIARFFSAIRRSNREVPWESKASLRANGGEAARRKVQINADGQEMDALVLGT